MDQRTYQSNSRFNILLLAEVAEDNTSILNSLCSYTVFFLAISHTQKKLNLLYTFQDHENVIIIGLKIRFKSEIANLVFVFFFVTWSCYL